MQARRMQVLPFVQQVPRAGSARGRRRRNPASTHQKAGGSGPCGCCTSAPMLCRLSHSCASCAPRLLGRCRAMFSCSGADSSSWQQLEERLRLAMPSCILSSTRIRTALGADTGRTVRRESHKEQAMRTMDLAGTISRLVRRDAAWAVPSVCFRRALPSGPCCASPSAMRSASRPKPLPCDLCASGDHYNTLLIAAKVTAQFSSRS